MLIQLLSKQYPGMRLWLTQRLTALVMMFYIILLLIIWLIKQPVDYASWLSFVAPIWFRVATLLFFMSLFCHAWLGVQDVLKDYIFNIKLRAVLRQLVLIVLWIYFVWLVFILWF